MLNLFHLLIVLAVVVKVEPTTNLEDIKQNEGGEEVFLDQDEFWEPPAPIFVSAPQATYTGYTGYTGFAGHGYSNGYSNGYGYASPNPSTYVPH